MVQTTHLSVDDLVNKELVPFRQRLIDAFTTKHPQMAAMANMFLSNKENMIGMIVTENGQPVGEYTFHFNGMQIQQVDNHKLNSAIHHPLLGVVKPYMTIERSALERMMADEENLKNNIFATAGKYLPDVTIKFLH